MDVCDLDDGGWNPVYLSLKYLNCWKKKKKKQRKRRKGRKKRKEKKERKEKK